MIKKLILLSAILGSACVQTQAEQCFDFTGNEIPDGWELYTRRSGGILNERLQAVAVDGHARLYTFPQEPLESVHATFDGFISDSYWGSIFGFGVVQANGDRYTVAHGNEGFEFGNDNYAYVSWSEVPGGYLETQQTPELFVEYTHEATFTHGLIEFQVRRKSDGFLVFDFSTPAPGLDLSETVEVRFGISHNSGPGVAWVDNVCVDLMPLDIDGDGIPNGEDACPNSNMDAFVSIDGCETSVSNLLFPDGCTLMDLIGILSGESVNHGDFVSGVAALMGELKQEGLVSGQGQGQVVRCAAKSSIP